MAAKKATTRKYRQAKQAAKPAAKAAFPGKKQAGRKDPKIKISAEDKLAIDEMKAQAKADLGKNAYLSKSEYQAQQKAAREKFRSQMRAEFGEYGGKKAEATDTLAPKRTPKAAKKSAVKPVSENAKKLNKTRTFVTAVETPSQTEKKPVKKAAVKKAAVKKVAVKPSKTMGEISKEITKTTKPATKKVAKSAKSAANKAAWAKMGPEERKNWNQNKPGAKGSTYTAARAAGKTPAEAAKAANPRLFKNPVAEAPAVMPKQATATAKVNVKTAKAPARPTDASLRANEDAYLEKTKARLAAENKAKANSAKGKTQTPQAEAAKAKAKPEGKPAAKKVVVKKQGPLRKLGKLAGKAFVLGSVGSEVGSIVKGSTEKDWKEIQRLENKLAAAQGKAPRYKNMGSNKNPIQAMTADASHMANLLSGSLVGKTRRDRMDELNRKIKAAEKKNASTASKPKPAAKTSYVATSAAGKKYLSPSHVAQNKKNVNIGSGGSTTRYVVKKGDTLSGIAKNAGLSLSEVRNMNPELMKNPKYKKGSMIWSGTKVNIKKK